MAIVVCLCASGEGVAKVPRGLDKALEKVWKDRDVTLRGLLDGEHMRCYEQFHASG